MSVRQPSRVLARLLLVAMVLSCAPIAEIARAEEKSTEPADLFKIFERPATTEWPSGKPAESVVAPASATTRATTADTGKDKRENANMSEIALCDADDGTEAARPGYGAPVAKFHPYSTPDFEKEVKAFIAERRRNLVDNQEMNGLHKLYGANSMGKPDLSKAVEARERFFNLTFGAVNPYGAGAVVSICETKRQLQDYLEKYVAQKKLSDAPAELNSCAGAFTTTKELYGKTRNAYRSYASTLKGYLNGRAAAPATNTSALPALELEFRELRSTNQSVLERYMGAPTAEKPVKLETEHQKRLATEFDLLWGTKSFGRKRPTKVLERGGSFSEVLLQIRKEKSQAEAQEKFFQDQALEMKKREEKCGGAVTPAASTVTGDGVKPTNEPAPTSTGGASTPHPRKDKDKPAPPVVPATGSPDDGSDTGAGTDTGGNTRPPRRPAPGSGSTDTGDGHTDDDADPPPRTKPTRSDGSGIGSFVKDNWMWLAGGAVLVGGGVYFYRQYEKDKRQKEYWQNDMNFMSTGTATGVLDTSAVQGAVPGGIALTNVPAGAKLIFTTPPSGASVGTVMSPIALALVDANGAPITTGNVQVEVSCLTPNPCSLDGTKSVSVAGGQVSFQNLKFNQPDQNVTLQFSAPGLPTLTAPSPFSVGGSTQRQ